VLELAPAFALSAAAVAERLNVDETEVGRALGAESTLLRMSDGTGAQVWTTAGKWEQVSARVGEIVRRVHAANPLLPGIEMEAVRVQLTRPIGPKLFRTVVDRLASAGVIVRSDSVIMAPDHHVTLAPGQEGMAAEIEATLEHAGYLPPDLKVLAAELRVPERRLADMLGVLEKQGRVVRVGGDIYYAASVVARARAALERFLQSRPEITAAEYRDCLGVSRKYSIALLDYFDRTGVTLRVGDVRRLRKGGIDVGSDAS
jgi:selenocysteine-specific elongation factor